MSVYIHDLYKFRKLVNISNKPMETAAQSREGGGGGPEKKLKKKLPPLDKRSFLLYLCHKKNPDSSPAQSLGEELPGLRCKNIKLWNMTDCFLKKIFLLSE